MNAITIIIAVLSAVAAIFAVIFFLGKKDVKKYENKADNLSKELNDLKCELARTESSMIDAMTPLTLDNIAEFLKKEKSGYTDLSEEYYHVGFKIKGERYNINSMRLPQQFIIYSSYKFNVEEYNLHFDILERAAVETMKKIVMVNIQVDKNEGFDFMIVSTTRTVAGLREDIDLFVTLIEEAKQILKDEYWKIMEIEHPEECRTNEDNANSNIEELAEELKLYIKDMGNIQS